MKLKQYILAFLILLTHFVFAQNKRFSTQGLITFEKKVNMHALIKEMIRKNPKDSYLPMFFEEYQKKQSQFNVLKSTLAFSNNQTLFTPIEPETNTNDFFGGFGAAQQNNVIATNTIAQTSIAQKKVYEETYLVKDSTRKINWKITNEIRNIAGYDCRRANALIMDSIYVVAFYTDEIPVSGGPESFTGLPGMILGVALPYEHITWFATSVVDQPMADNKLKAPTKGKPLTNAGLSKTLKEALKNWGDYAQQALKEFML
ncbi:GLPGLI family protein [Pedobacter insulae]|uniref:GLPGLI family protein n=1 Tax=Pedobacter insulae TaxID=414048 RepID=A0A1I2YVQ7_9SPHI|nr:GLPGLI family protein [Pedobacter insulae]SFH29505.1 GLPGLI family protein [Pedobacter insulae]